MEKAKSKIDAYKESIDIKHSKEIIKCTKLDIAKYKVETKEIDLVDKPDLSRYFKLESDIQSKLEKLARIRYVRDQDYGEFNRLSSLIHSFEASDPDALCPHCNGELMVHGKSISKPDDIAIHKANHDAKMTEHREQMKIKKSAIDGYDAELVNENLLRNLLTKSREKKEQQSRSYNTSRDRLRSVLGAIEQREVVIEQHKANIERASELKTKVDVLKKYVVKAASIIEEHNDSIKLYKVISAMYAPTGAPAYIMDSIVDSFNEIVSDHISLVWPNASYSLQSYKEDKKSGDLTAKFSESLVINGSQISIGSLSGGEQRAVSLSIDFAIADILSQQFGIPLNPIIMDEPFEGLDATGREIVIELLNKLSLKRQIWVVDHASEAKAMFSQIIRIEKRNGTSDVVSQPLV